MASFPTSAHSFSDFSNGATSDASQVTDIYDEVEAIEDGYLNGTARLNSSHSTVVTLSVTGKSTLAGNVNISGDSTLANLSVSGGSTLATLQVDGNSSFAARPLMPPPAAVGVVNSTTGLANDSTTAVEWVNQLYAVNSSLHSTATNPERFTPQTTGVYVLSASVSLAASFGAGSTAFLLVDIVDSSDTILMRGLSADNGESAAGAVVTAAKHFDATGGYLRVVARQRSGSTHSLNGNVCTAHFWKL